MTIICYDGTTLAGDRRACTGTTINMTTKLFRVKDGIMGVAGSACGTTEFIEWFNGAREVGSFPHNLRTEEDGCAALFVGKDNKVWVYACSPTPMQIIGKFTAVGSGSEGAMVAMYLGKSASEAVKIVAKFNCACGNGVDTLKL